MIANSLQFYIVAQSSVNDAHPRVDASRVRESEKSESSEDAKEKRGEGRNTWSKIQE